MKNNTETMTGVKGNMTIEEFVEGLTEEDFDKDSLYQMLFDIEDERIHGKADCLIRQKAKEIGERRLVQLYVSQKRGYEKKRKKESRKKKDDDAIVMTRYTDLPEGVSNLACRERWIADDDGVRIVDEKGSKIVCGHPLLIASIRKSMNTKEERAELAYHNGGEWSRISCDKSVLASAYKITELSKFGLSVTTQNARDVVAFLQDIEDCSRKNDMVPVIYTTSRLGWNKDKTEFLPFTDKDIEFDGNRGLPYAWDALQETGSREAWYKEFCKMRKIDMVHFLSTAYLASALVSMLERDGFVVNVYGESRGGKSVSNKIACSVWFGYRSGLMFSADNTDNSIDGMMGILKNIPFVMEDLNNMNAAKQKSQQSMVMKICNGVGKARMGQDGNTREVNTWCTTAGVTSEFRLIKDFENGGAINRSLMMRGADEADCPFNREGMDTANLLEFFAHNHGFAGKDFTRALVETGIDKLNRRLQEITIQVDKKIREMDRSGGQAGPVALMLLADEIAEEYLFHDGIRFGIEEAVANWTENKDSVNQFERFYDVLKDHVAQNSNRFEGWRLQDASNNKYAGLYFPKENKVAILKSELKELADEHNVDLKLFLEHLDKKGQLEKDKKGNFAKVTYSPLLKKSQRMYVISLSQHPEEEEVSPDFGRGQVEESAKIYEEFPFTEEGTVLPDKETSEQLEFTLLSA